jgi:hypothetical protein
MAIVLLLGSTVVSLSVAKFGNSQLVCVVIIRQLLYLHIYHS